MSSAPPGLFYLLTSIVHAAPPYAQLHTVRLRRLQLFQFLPTLPLRSLAALVVISASVGCETVPLTQPDAQDPPQPGSVPARRIPVGTGVIADLSAQCVEVQAVVCMDDGYLEQLVCRSGTREHESILAFQGRPRDIHAALLLIGTEPGTPGQWSQRIDANGVVVVETTPPSGEPLDLRVRWDDGGVPREAPLTEWAMKLQDRSRLNAEFIFAGSFLEAIPNRLPDGTPTGTSREVYAADMGGSVVGLVTFGDEVIARREVLPDKADIAEPIWVADPSRIPPLGTPVTLLITRTAPPSTDTAPRADSVDPALAP